jgi:soluble lytic murein transglycosylase-like protein
MYKKPNGHNILVGIGVGIVILGMCATGFHVYQLSANKIPPKPPTIVQPTKDLSKIIQIAQPKIDPAVAEEVAKSVKKYSKEYGFPPELIIAIIKQESAFRPMTVSKANCVGLMQINAKMHQEKLTKLNVKGAQIFHIDNNIHLGCLILKEYYDATGTVSGALKKYLGATNHGYLLAILSSFADLVITKNK